MEVPINRSGEISKSGLPLTSSEATENLALPFDVTKIIFSGLSEEDLLSTIKVSTEWKKACLELSKNEYNSIEAFVNWIALKLGEIQKAKLPEVMEGTTIHESIHLARIKLYNQELLQQFSSIVGGLTEVMEGTPILESINLAKIKLSTQELLQQVLSIVGGLNGETISYLETLVKKEHKPSFFETLLKLAIIEHDLEDASKIEYFSYRSKAFKEISNRLTALGQHDKALDIALKCKSSVAIKNVIEPVIISNNIKKASEMINRAVEIGKFSKISLLIDLFKIFEENKNWEQVFEIINLTIPELPTNLDQIIFDDETTFLDVFIKGVELSKKEPDFISKTPSFATLVGSLALAFTSSSENPRIDNILKTIPSSVLYDISVKLVESGLKFKAFAVLQRIDDPDYQERVSDLRKLMAG